MNKLALSIVMFSLLFCHFSPVSDARADMYKYTDSSGTVNITNNLESVPAKYRSNMKVVREAAKPAPSAASQAQQSQPEPAQAAAPEQESAQAPAQAPAGKFAELSARYPWFKPMVYLGVIVLLAVLVFKVTSLLPSPLLAKAICIAFFLGVFVFLYKSYVDHVATSTAKIKENATKMMKNSMVREQPQPDNGTSLPTK